MLKQLTKISKIQIFIILIDKHLPKLEPQAASFETEIEDLSEIHEYCRRTSTVFGDDEKLKGVHFPMFIPPKNRNS
jgi:hypothetical protein